jgi:hypothetical protein
MMTLVLGLRGTNRLVGFLVLFSLVLIVILCAILFSIQPASA